MSGSPKKRPRNNRARRFSTSETAPAILVAALGLALRLVAAAGVGGLPISRAPQYDALEYLRWAQQIASGDFRWIPNPPHGPAYPYFLGALLAISNGSLPFARVAQSLLGTATCCIAGLIAARLFGRRAGIVTALLLAVYAPLIWLDVSIASEGLLMFLLAASLWSAVRERHPLLTGALIGLAALTRPTALAFLPLLVWIGARTTKRRAAMVAAAIAVILPVTIANWRTAHAFIPIQAFGGMNFYLGNTPLRDGTASARPGGEWESLEAEAVRHGAADSRAEDAYFTSKTFGEIGLHPGAFARLLLRKTLLTFQNEEVRDTHSFYFFRELVSLLRWLPGFMILFAFAVAGAATLNWRDRPVWIAAIYTALAAAACIALVAGARYRIPVVLGLALFGGAVANIRTRRQVVIGVVAGLIAAACTRIESVPSSHNFAEEWAISAQSLLTESDVTAADDASQRALQIDPSSALAWDTRGSVFAALGQAQPAADAFRRALALNPGYAGAHRHFAAFLAQTGDVANAAAQYRQAVAIDPRDAEALWALARLDGALGNAADGLDAAHRAAAIRPPADDDWLVMAMLAADLRRFGEADDALAHITESTPRVEEVRRAIRQRFYPAR